MKPLFEASRCRLVLVQKAYDQDVLDSNSAVSG